MNVKRKLKSSFAVLSFFCGFTALNAMGDEPATASTIAMPIANQAQNGTITQSQLDDEMSLVKGEINQAKADRQLIQSEMNNPQDAEKLQADQARFEGEVNTLEQNRVKFDNDINLYEGEKGALERERAEIEPERAGLEEFRGGGFGRR